MQPGHWILLALAVVMVAPVVWALYRQARGGSMFDESPVIDIDKDGVPLGEELKAAGEKVAKRFDKQERAALRRSLFAFVVQAITALIDGKISPNEWKALGQSAKRLGAQIVEAADED